MSDATLTAEMIRVGQQTCYEEGYQGTCYGAKTIESALTEAVKRSNGTLSLHQAADLFIRMANINSGVAAMDNTWNAFDQFSEQQQPNVRNHTLPDLVSSYASLYEKFRQQFQAAGRNASGDYIIWDSCAAAELELVKVVSKLSGKGVVEVADKMAQLLGAVKLDSIDNSEHSMAKAQAKLLDAYPVANMFDWPKQNELRLAFEKMATARSGTDLEYASIDAAAVIHRLSSPDRQPTELPDLRGLLPPPPK